MRVNISYYLDCFLILIYVVVTLFIGLTDWREL